MYRSCDKLEKRGSHDLHVFSVLFNILTDSFGGIHVVTVFQRHLLHHLNQRLNQTPQIIVAVNPCK